MLRAFFHHIPSLIPNNVLTELPATPPPPTAEQQPTMRLRLRIERNGLPPTQTLWPIDNARQTIAQLVQTINDTFPLEAGTWGLEDYAVSVGGYDCLHYHELRAVCKDDDEVVVRPLQWEDVRGRTLAGRHQIASDGRHLLDGVPFGRPRVRAPVRPDVRIPPRKRRRVESEEVGGGELAVEEESEDDDDDEEDFDVDESVEEESSSSPSSSADESEEASSSDEYSSDGSSSDDESWNGLSPEQPPSPGKKHEQSLPNGIPTSIQTKTPNTTTSKRKRDADDDGSSTPIATPVLQGLPYQGQPATKARNVRRREANRLKRLKDEGLLPADATLAMMRELDVMNTTTGAGDSTTVDADIGMAKTSSTRDTVIAEPLVAKHASEEQLATPEQPPDSNVPDRKKAKKAKKQLKGESTTETPLAETDEFQRRRQKLLADIESGGVEVRSAYPSDKVAALNQPAPDAAVTDKAIAMPGGPSPSTPRSRLNLATSARLVFGSLGVRVPKTQEEKDALQEKLAQRPAVNVHRHSPSAASALPNGDTAEPEVIDNPADAVQTDLSNEHWSAKIHLTAVECCDEGVVLSTPPFPFHQRWDPQQRKKKNRKGKAFTENVKAGKKRKRGEVFEETYDKYYVSGSGDALEYDDAEDEDWENGALLGTYDDDDHEDDDGFPPLPSDTQTLPTLSQHEAQPGDFITFTELACDERTHWQPQTTSRMAQILSRVKGEEDAGIDAFQWMLAMSARDRPRKLFDDEGNRVYRKFEMPDKEDEEELEDEGTRTVGWEELGDVRLLSRSAKEGEGQD